MLYTLDLQHPETFPPMLNQFHLEQLAIIFPSLDINLTMVKPMEIFYHCRDEFYQWLEFEEGYIHIKDENWKIALNPENKIMKMTFATATPRNDVARKMGEKLGILLCEYQKSKQ